MMTMIINNDHNYNGNDDNIEVMMITLNRMMRIMMGLTIVNSQDSSIFCSELSGNLAPRFALLLPAPPEPSSLSLPKK